MIGLPGPGGGAFVWATAEGYEDDLQDHLAVSQDFRLYRIERISAGSSTVVTMRPDDSLCWNNIHEPGYGTTMYAERCALCPLPESSLSKRSPSAEDLALLLS